MSAPIKFVLSVLMTGLTLIAWVTADRWLTRLPKRWPLYLILVLMLSRLVMLVVAFGILRVPLSGNSVGYWENIEAIHAGLIPFRDFGSSFSTPYNPLFYYLMALAQNPFQMSLLLSIFEVVSFVLLFSLVRLALSEQQMQLWGVLYLLSPLALWWSTLGGQEDALILAFYVLALLIFLVKRDGLGSFLGGVVMALGFLATKIMALLPVPLMLGFARRLNYAIVGYLILGLTIVPLTLLMGPNLILFTTGASGSVGAQSAPSTWMI